MAVLAALALLAVSFGPSHQPAVAAPEATTSDPATRPVAGEVTRIAGLSGPTGVGYSGDGGPATDARLNTGLDIAAGPNGSIYLADRGNGRLRVIDPEGTIRTMIHATRSPENDVDLDEGWTYSPSNRPRSVDVTDDGAVVVGATTDVTRVTPGGEKSVLAGGGEQGLPEPGESLPGEATSLHRASAVAVSSDGTVYAYLAGAGRIIAIDEDGSVRVLAGGGEADRARADGSRPATDYAIGRPEALAVADSGPLAGTVFFTTELHSRVMAIDPDGRLDVFAGTGESGFSGDGGPAREALLSDVVQGLAVTTDGELLIADTYNAAIRRVDHDGIITTVRGSVGQVDSLDVLPNGDIIFTRGALALRLTMDGASATEATGPVEAGADPFASAEAGEVVHVAGAEEPAAVRPEPPTSPQSYPHASGVTVDADGSVVYGDRATATVRRVEPDGSTSVVAGVWPPPEEAAEGSPPDTVRADEHVLDGVQDVATTADGQLLIAEPQRIWKLDDEGTMTQVFDGGDSGPIRGITTDAQGSIYLTQGDLVRRITPAGDVDPIAGGGQRWADEVDGHPALEASLWEPTDVAVDSSGTVYLTEGGRPHVRAITPDGTITTALGDSYRGQDEGGFAGDGGPGVEAELNTPLGLAVAPDDALLVADTYNARVRRLDTDGTVTTVAGTGRVPDPAGPTGESDPAGPALDTAIGEPTSLALDADGNLVFATTRPDRIYRLTDDAAVSVLLEMDAAPDEPLPAADAPLSGVQDLAIGPDGLPTVTGQAGMLTIDGTVSEFGTSGGNRLASAEAMYLARSTSVSRVFPDGRTVPVAGGGSTGEAEGPLPGRSLSLEGGVPDVAIGPDGSVFVLSLVGTATEPDPETTVHRISTDGTATGVDTGAVERLHALAAGPDGTLYGIEAEERQVLRLDGEGSVTVVAARDEDSGTSLVDEPFGTATALPSGQPQDLAVGPHGHLFVATSAGVLVIDPVEDTYAFHDGLWPEEQFNVRIAADRHGNAYTLSHDGRGPAARVSALVHPAEVTAPSEVPWLGIIAGAGGLVLLAGAVLVWQLRRRRQQAPVPAPGPDVSEST